MNSYVPPNHPIGPPFYEWAHRPVDLMPAWPVEQGMYLADTNNPNPHHFTRISHATQQRQRTHDQERIAQLEKMLETSLTHQHQLLQVSDDADAVLKTKGPTTVDTTTCVASDSESPTQHG